MVAPTITKRKFEEYDDERNGDSNQGSKMRKDGGAAGVAVVQRPEHLQFFVRLISDKTLVVRADPSETVESVYQKIGCISKVSLGDQGLTYRGKQLQEEQTLAECGVENDSTLNLVGRLRSTGCLRAWHLINDVVSLVFNLLSTTPNSPDATSSFRTAYNSKRGGRMVKSMLGNYLFMMDIVVNRTVKVSGHLKVFYESSAAAALVMLYMSPLRHNRDMADDAIRSFIVKGRAQVPEQNHCSFVQIVLEFCKLLRVQTGAGDPLYRFLRHTLGAMMRKCVKLKCDVNAPERLKETFPFVSELAWQLSHDLPLNGPNVEDVKDLVTFLVPLRSRIERNWVLDSDRPIKLPLQGSLAKLFPVCCSKELSGLYEISMDLLGKMDYCMKRVQEEELVGTTEWNQYLLILRELHETLKLYENGLELFGDVMKRRGSALNHLVVSHAKWSDDNKWILQFKEVMNFEARHHLAMMTLPDMKEQYAELHEMLIDRSNLLSESFEYVTHADLESLGGGLLVEFKNEEATGPGVLREWFLLVCQAMFNPQNALYLACPNDRRRFYPNPASKVDPLHLEYFYFSGRVIALALMHKIQVGIVFDRVFFKQLAGDDDITLEDIRDADPRVYSSCKQILEMDPQMVDQDALGLTFVHEIEELGRRKVIKLCPNGDNVAVNSRNRERYIDALIRTLFVDSIAEQVDNFAEGFADVASSKELHNSFFQWLNAEDLDMMLYGSDKPICIDDWKAHTQLHGFEQSDDQISWFWEIVASMSPEQKKTVLFFWTSLKYLPVEGFRGLASKLYIYKSSQKWSCLPTSNTCFYRLNLPSYPSLSHMRERLHIIAQEHVGCSFGTW